MLKKLKFFIQHLKTLSPRASIIATTFTNVVAKIIGYVRFLLIAYFFGISAEMDSYNIATGAIGLAMGLLGTIIHMSAVPHMMKLSATNEEQAKSLFACIVRFVLCWGLLISIFLISFPKEYLNVFAYNLDEKRIDITVKLMYCLLPLSFFQLLQGLLSIWMNYKGSYAIGSILGLFITPIATIVMVLTVDCLGIYSIVLSLTITTIAFESIMFFLFKDFPLKITNLPRDVIKKISKDALLCIVLAGTGLLYAITDKWFASGLSVGSISSIGYSGQIIAVILSFTAIANRIHLTHSSKISGNQSHIEEILNKSLAIAWAYILPVTFGTVVLSIPVVKLLLGYGQFNDYAIILTASCLSASAIVMPFIVWTMIICNYGIAMSKLKIIVISSLISVVSNVVLDWLLTPIWGVVGICLATSFNIVLVTVFCLIKLAPKNIVSKQISSIAKQSLIAIILGIALYFISDYGIISIGIGAIFGMLHLFICEYFGFMEQVSDSWKPIAMSKTIFRRLKIM